MTDLLEKIALVSQRANPKWTALRERALKQRLDRSIARRRTLRASLSAALAALVVIAVGGGFWRQLIVERAPALAASATLLALEDGSTVSALSKEARVTPVEVGPTATTIRLESGSARFDVTPHPERRFRVLAEDVVVSVLGTAFTLERGTEGVRVRVERGRVEVTWPGERRELSAGEQLLRAREPEQTTRVPKAEALPAHDAPLEPVPALGASASSPRSTKSQSWRQLAQDGDYRAAFTRMTAEGSAAVRDEPDDLLFAADVARLSGHPNLAVPRLERVMRAHGGDSRSPLAAFTLGRTLLDELGRPREAAEAFAAARRLAPGGALSRDALAREVESWSRAGESRLARARAKEYLERYPKGRRSKAVRYHGGLE